MGANRLKWWICFSGALHLVLIVTLLLAPTSTARRDLPVPVYTVDLVTGGSPAPRPQPLKPAPRETKPARVEPLPEADESDEAFAEPPAPKPPETAKAPEQPPPPPKEKEQVKIPPEPKVKEASPPKPKKKVVKPKKKTVKPKKVVKRKKPSVHKKVAGKKKAEKKRAPKRPVKLVKKTPAKPKRSIRTDSRVVERVRRTRIEDAVATARERANLRRKVGVGQGSGTGTGALGGGKGTGGLVKGREFVAYLNEMRRIFKERWTWFGKRSDLEAKVGFGVRVDGEIFGLKLLEPSGDTSYDDSVVRAVRRSSPLPPPPRRYARDFAEVEFTFRPDDADG